MKIRYTVSAFGWMLITNFYGEEVRANCESYKKEFTNKEDAIVAIEMLKAKRVAWDMIALHTVESFI